MDFAEYLGQIRAGINLPSVETSDLTEELRGHLEDAAQELQLAGMNSLDSEREAMRRLGSPKVIAAAFRTERKRASRRPRVLAGAAALAASLLGSAAVSAAHYQHPPVPSAPAANHAASPR
ncbi:MAG TPA: permease prefix domain 1-containing protein [Chloroflexota bacterium]|nr:permease prefix domain 1-containing protein [Chloroflexota bacterium]